MNEKQLSERLIRVAHFVPKNTKVADIGSDHAYLPCYLCLRNEGITAIAGEVNEGPFRSAQKQVKQLALTDRIDVRKGNGLEILEPNEVDVITIAGMGGALITTILEEGKEKLKGVKRLILQPNLGSHIIRQWLRDNGWRLQDEQILEEDKMIYEILVAERGEDDDLYDSDTDIKLLVGPYLLSERSDSFYKKWHHEVKSWKRILEQLSVATENGHLTEKKSLLTERVKMVEEVLQR